MTRAPDLYRKAAPHLFHHPWVYTTDPKDFEEGWQPVWLSSTPPPMEEPKSGAVVKISGLWNGDWIKNVSHWVRIDSGVAKDEDRWFVINGEYTDTLPISWADLINSSGVRHGPFIEILFEGV